MNVHLNKTSTFAALRNPVYRKLWLAVLLSGTCVAAQDTAATWTMNMLGSSTFLLSLISTVASLPFFLFTLPAGALADMVNRRKLITDVADRRDERFEEALQPKLRLSRCSLPLPG